MPYYNWPRDLLTSDIQLFLSEQRFTWSAHLNAFWDIPVSPSHVCAQLPHRLLRWVCPGRCGETFTLRGVDVKLHPAEWPIFEWILDRCDIGWYWSIDQNNHVYIYSAVYLYCIYIYTLYSIFIYYMHTIYTYIHMSAHFLESIMAAFFSFAGLSTILGMAAELSATRREGLVVQRLMSIWAMKKGPLVV